MIVVPAAILAEIRDHAAEAEDAKFGQEVYGRLVLVGDEVVRYDRGRNVATEAYRCQPATSWRPRPGERGIWLHSHPVGEARPSPGDLHFCASRQGWWATCAIYGVRDDEIAVFRVAEDESFEAVEVVVSDPSTAPAPREEVTHHVRPGANL